MLKRSHLSLAAVLAASAPIALAAPSYALDVSPELANGYVGANVTLLGAPKAQASSASGGLSQQFASGILARANGSSQAYAVVGPMTTALNAAGGLGKFGFPTSQPTKISGGYAQTFTGGAITSASLASGTSYTLPGAQGSAFTKAGGMYGQIGVATGGGPVSWYSGHSTRWFTSGMLDLSNGYAVKGGIGNYFRNTPGVSATLTTPTGNESPISGGWKQTFAGGAIYYSWGGAHAYVKGGIKGRYESGGGPATFGWPTAPERTDATYGWVQPTTKGTFYYSTGSLTKPATTTPKPPSSTVSTRYTTSKVNVRSAASTSSSIVTTLSAGTKVTGTISGSWLKVTSPSNIAGRYISTSVLASSAPTTPKPPTSGAWKPAAQYVQPASGPYAAQTGYTLGYGFNGIKVYLAQKKLGIAYSPMNSKIGPSTSAKIKSFQSSHGLVADGVIGPATWAKLNTGYSFDIDAWKQPSKVSTTASRTERVNAMVNYAKAQINKPYIWGGTGPMGFDCSGFLLQAMRAGGIDPKNVSNYTNVRPASDLSHQMQIDSEFQKGSMSNLQVGDLIYYGGSDGVARHVSMYIGGGKVINASGSKVYISSTSDHFGWSRILGVNRPMAL